MLDCPTLGTQVFSILVSLYFNKGGGSTRAGTDTILIAVIFDCLILGTQVFSIPESLYFNQLLTPNSRAYLSSADFLCRTIS
uniref:AGO905 n=1 Tax=Arundo donax TaxID=35708 RepID=A0A0A9HKH0_ARUDO